MYADIIIVLRKCLLVFKKALLQNWVCNIPYVIVFDNSRQNLKCLINFSYNATLQMSPSASTSHIHDGVVMTEYENEPFIIGDYTHNNIEFMHLSHQKWYSGQPFPYHERIFGYAVVSRPGKVFVLGGCCDNVDDTWSQISLFQTDGWQVLPGSLKQGRMNFLAITYQTDILIVGGITKERKP